MPGTSQKTTPLLTHEEIGAISLDVVRQYSNALEFVGVMASEGGSGRVEIMVTMLSKTNCARNSNRHCGHTAFRSSSWYAMAPRRVG